MEERDEDHIDNPGSACGTEQLSDGATEINAASIQQERHQHLPTQDKEIQILHLSPWKSYRKIFQLKLGKAETSVVAEKLSPAINEDNSVVLVQSLSGSNVQDQIRSLRQIRHANFVTALAAFQVDHAWLVAFEFMPISLSEFAGNPLLNELRVASILGQVST